MYYSNKSCPIRCVLFVLVSIWFTSCSTLGFMPASSLATWLRKHDHQSSHQRYKLRMQSSLHYNGEYCDSGQVNVLGTPLKACCCSVKKSGDNKEYFRNSYCNTIRDDKVCLCAVCNKEFISYSKLFNNYLLSSRPETNLSGLVLGDKWCLSVDKWIQAHNAGFAPKLYLQGCHEQVLKYIPIDILMDYAVDIHEAREIRERLKYQRKRLESFLSLPLEGVFE